MASFKTLPMMMLTFNYHSFADIFSSLGGFYSSIMGMVGVIFSYYLYTHFFKRQVGYVKRKSKLSAPDSEVYEDIFRKVS